MGLGMRVSNTRLSTHFSFKPRQQKVTVRSWAFLHHARASSLKQQGEMSCQQSISFHAKDQTVQTPSSIMMVPPLPQWDPFFYYISSISWCGIDFHTATMRKSSSLGFTHSHPTYKQSNSFLFLSRLGIPILAQQLHQWNNIPCSITKCRAQVKGAQHAAQGPHGIIHQQL